LNEKLYGASRPDKELLDSIREHGILEPLIVAENLIISGHRRWQAAKIITAENKQSEKTIYLMTMRPAHSPNDAWYEDEAKYKFWRENPLLLEQLIIEANRQRVKTKGQIAREAAELMRIEKALAAERRESALKKGKKTPVPPPKADEAAVVPSEGTTEGKARDIVAKKLNQSKNTVEKEVAIVSAAEAGDPKAQEVLAKLDRNEISVAAAHRAVITPQRKVEDASKNLRRIEAAAACIKGSAVAPLLKVRQINTAKEQAAVLALRADLQCLLDHLGRLL
jgi:hypothetical protein